MRIAIAGRAASHLAAAGAQGTGCPAPVRENRPPARPERRPARPPLCGYGSADLRRLMIATLLIGALGVGGCRTAPPEPAHLERFEYTEPQMGVPFRIVMYAPDRAGADAAARAAFDRISALNAILSDYEYDSELSRLSRTAGSGEAIAVSAELWTVLERAQDLARRSDGAFDVTVGPVVSLWRKARRDQALPEPRRLQAALAATGWRHLELDPPRRTARLVAPRMRLDLGGIAKGYAVDEALRVLGGRGIRRALVSGGGDLAVSDPPPGRAGWRIEVPPLDAPNAPEACHVLLRNEALATSGDVFQFVEIGGVRYSHIVDPATGLGLTDHSQITVIARDGLTADSLSTALSVRGPGRVSALARHHRAAYRLMRCPGNRVELHENAAFRRRLDGSSAVETSWDPGRGTTPDSKGR